MKARIRIPIALHSPAFTRNWLGFVVSSVGTQVNIVASAWVLYRMTNSTTSLGIGLLSFAVPMVVVPLLAGPIIDRVDRFAVVKYSLAAECATAACLAVVSGTGALHPWIFYVAACLDACRLAFTMPAQMALTPLLVPKNALISAQSLSSAAWTSTALIGPAVGGFILAASNATTAFGLNAAVTGLALVMIFDLHADGIVDRQSSAVAGIRYVFSHQWVLLLQVLLICMGTLAQTVETLLPDLTIHQWNSSSAGYGLLRAAPGFAAVVAGLAMSMISNLPRRPLIPIALSVAVAAPSMALFTHAPDIYSGWIILGFASAAVTAAQIFASTQLWQRTPKEYLGSLGALVAISQVGIPGLAASGTAAVADSVGSPAAIVGATIVTGIIGLTAVSLLRGSLRLDTETQLVQPTKRG